MKKHILAVILFMLLMIHVVNAEERINVKILMDGEELAVDNIMAMYKNGEMYENPAELTKEGLALIFAQATKGNEVWYFSKEVDLRSGDNILRFNKSEMNQYKIVMGENTHPLEDRVFVEFENLPSETKLELKIQTESTLTVHMSDALEIYRVMYSDVQGSIGINASQGRESDDNRFLFDGNYYLKSKTEHALMPSRPSFDDLFEICYSDDLPIDSMFEMGDGGGCDYRYFNEDGEVVLERRFGQPSNGLHFENLSEGIYDMEFDFNNGDLILTAKSIAFVNEAKSANKNIEADQQPFEVYVENLPISGSEIDIHELMKKEEKKFVFVIEENDQVDGNVFNQDDIDLFEQNNKEFSIKTNFVEIEFDKALINEMSKTDRDLSIHIKNGLSFYSQNEGSGFMENTYNLSDDMSYVCDYEIKVFLAEYDLIAGDFSKRPTLIFYPYDLYLENVDFRHVSVYSDIDKNEILDFLGGSNKENSIKVELHNPTPYYYFSLYEKNITFDDINDSWAKEYIEVMAAKNIINGISEGEFNPKGTLTKAQFTTLLVKALNGQLAEYQGIYTDCKQTDWFTPYVETAYALELTDIVKGEAYYPQMSISRQDMAIMAVKAYMSYTGSSPVITNPTLFTDTVDLSKEYLDYISKATELNLISGMPDGTFKPDDTLTREQAAVVIYRLLEVINSNVQLP